MKAVSVKPNQTVYDIAIEQYGTCEAIGEILANNPGLTNDPAVLTALGIDSVNNPDFYPDAALEPRTTVRIDTDSDFIRSAALREITKEITTFSL